MLPPHAGLLLCVVLEENASQCSCFDGTRQSPAVAAKPITAGFLLLVGAIRDIPLSGECNVAFRCGEHEGVSVVSFHRNHAFIDGRWFCVTGGGTCACSVNFRRI